MSQLLRSSQKIFKLSQSNKFQHSARLITSTPNLTKIARNPTLNSSREHFLGSATISRSQGTKVEHDLVEEYFGDKAQKQAVQDKSLSELALAAAVLKLCTMDALVAKAPQLLDLAKTMRVDFLSNLVIKKTFFDHFCGGATDAEVEKTIKVLEKQGIQPILDLAFEADLETAEDTGPGESVAPDSKIVKMTQGTINLASKAQDGFVALKITAFASPAVLSRISNLLNAINRLFEETSGPDMSTVGEEDLVRLVRRLSGLPESEAKSTVQRIFGKPLKERGSVDWNDFSRLLSPIDAFNRPLLQMIETEDEDFPMPTADDYKELDSAWEICSSLIKQAQEQHVTITVDAEWTFSQPAIDLLVMHLMREFNKFGDPDGPLVFNTIQMYLKDGLPRLKLDLARAEREGFTYGVKLVRGAYMFMERERAAELEIPDPIHESIEATHKAYNDGVELLLTKAVKAEAQKNGNEVNFILASHNAESIVSAMKKMEELGLEKGTRIVRFAQLQGMKDYLTKTLARLGYRAYKYVPYGPVEITIPYLLRRAQENSTLLGTAVKEREALVQELRGRLGLSRKN